MIFLYVDMCSKLVFVIYKHRIAGVQSTQQSGIREPKYMTSMIYKGEIIMFQGIKKLFGSKKEKEQILAPVAGQAVPLSEVPDPAFAQEILGKGVAIQPAENEFRAPASGEVTVLFETGHAVSIRTESGADVIVHIGLDTVNLKGQFFTTHVKQGDTVKAGDLLITADIEQIKAAGYDVITPVIVCNVSDFPDMVCHPGKTVKAMDEIITL